MRIRDALAALVLAIGLALPLVVGEWPLTQLAQYLAYGILAMSLALIWGQAGILCLGQALFFGIGAYAMSLTTLDMLPLVPASSAVGLALALLLPAATAWAIGSFLFFGRGLEGAYLGIVTLALAILAERLATSSPLLGGSNGLMGIPPLALAGHEVWEPVAVYYLNLTAAALAFLTGERLVRSRRGILLRAVAADETRTSLLGHDTRRLKLQAFTASAAMAGLAGALFVAQFGFVSPTLLGFGLSAEALIWTALGGKTLLLAAFLGAVITRYVEAAASDLLGAWWPMLVGLFFVLTVILLPRGLIGEAVLRLEERRRR